MSGSEKMSNIKILTDNLSSEQLNRIFFFQEYGTKYDSFNEEHTEIMASMMCPGLDW